MIQKEIHPIPTSLEEINTDKMQAVIAQDKVCKLVERERPEPGPQEVRYMY